jgi:hypothetical protein
MKSKIVFLSIIFLTFFLAPLVALPSENEEGLQFVNRLVARARQLEDYFSKGSYSEILKMLPGLASEKTEVQFFLKDISEMKQEMIEQAKVEGNHRLTLLESTQNYGVTVCAGSSNSAFKTYRVGLVFFKDGEHDDTVLCKNLASYVDGDNGLKMQVLIDFSAASKLPSFSEFNFTNAPKMTRIEWDTNGTIRKFENPQLLAGKNEAWPFPEIKKTDETAKFVLIGTTVRLPKSDDKEVMAIFDRLGKLSSVKKIEDMHNMYQWQLTNTPEAVGGIGFTSQKLRYIAFASPTRNTLRGENTLQGYFLRFSPEGHILAYAEGMMRSVPNLQDIDDSVGDIFTVTEWVVFDMRLVIENGVEISFHENGVPSKYRTHVKHDRLFGRQIEWDEKGKVTSDVDLDIPMPWADAPDPIPEPSGKPLVPEEKKPD